MAETGIITGVIEEIGGGAMTTTGTHHFSSVEFIRIAGKRIRSIRLDSYIGSALHSAFDDDEKISLALYKGNIVAIKRASGEISRSLAGPLTILIINFLRIFIPGFVISLFTFGQIAGNTESFITWAIPGGAILLTTFYLIFSRTSKQSDMRNSFDSDS
ncbi:hypothetical protein [Metapseudomonas furukawaii]